MNTIAHTVTTLFDRMTQPHQRVVDESNRQRSRLLSRMLLLSIIAAVLLAPIIIAVDMDSYDDPEYLVLAIGLVSAVGLFFINRRGHVETAATGFIGLVYAAFTFAPFIPASSDNVMALAFVPLLLTAIFFPVRNVFVVGLLVLISASLLNLLSLGYPISASTFAIILATMLLIIFIQHQQAMEALRRRELENTNRKLRQSEEHLQTANAELGSSNRKLRQSEEHLQTANAELEHRVEERTHDLATKNDELSRAWEAAKHADLVKSQFLASMSHELRTPLNSVLNFTEFVNMGMLGAVNERQHDALTKALDSGRHLLMLINDVLDITKIESDKMSLFVEENIDFLDIINSGVTTAQSLLKDKPVKFISEIDVNLPPITADKRRIRQVLFNLLANACKFTEEGSVLLRVKNEGSTLLLSVVDTGPGIAGKDQNLIFEPFKQTVMGIQHAGGTGLGLPISLRLVEAHYGKLWVESEPGKGAAFYVRLPVRSPELLKLLNGAAV